MDRQRAGSDSRHHCSHEGCGKSFIRKEHLTRHALSHTENPSYICNICFRAFTRNDVLQKHIRSHTARQESTERNKRACQPCHKAKTRCAGGLPCQSCVKRRIPCTFDNASGMSSGSVQESTSSGSSSIGWEQQQGQIRRDSYYTSEPQAGQYAYSASQYSAPYQQERNLSIASTSSGYADSFPSPQQLLYNTSTYTPTQPTVNWQPTFQSNYQLPSPNSGYLNRPHANSMEGESEAGEQYFSHFHPRWPIIHMCSYDESEAPWTLNYSVVMVGNYLISSNETKQKAIDIHNKLLPDLVSTLTSTSWRPASDEDSRAWGVFQSCLLNIIFAFYTGENTLISRAITLLSTLVSILKEIGLFRPERAMTKFQAGAFLPWTMIQFEQRKRLAISLFKIDTYLSLLRSQPPMLRPEEMQFSLPTTYTFWNLCTLENFDQHLAAEPPERQIISMFDLMRSPFTNHRPSLATTGPNAIEGMLLFPEDIQLGLCSLQAPIWEAVEKARDSTVNEVTIATIRTLLTQQVDYWKSKLGPSSSSLDDVIDPYNCSSAISLTTSCLRQMAPSDSAFYHAIENRKVPGWQNVVLSRPRSLIFDTTMLHHLLSIHIHTDIRNLCRIANFQSQNTVELRQSRLSASTWATSTSSTAALTHAGKILELARQQGGDLDGSTAEPIMHMTLYVGALVVWAWSAFSGVTCNGACQSGGQYGRDATRGTFIDGMVLCTCTTQEIIARFRSYVPEGDRGWARHLMKFQGG